MALDAPESWRNCFRQWPADLERRGVLITAFGEQIPFEGFATNEDFILIERRAPDTLGGRSVMISYQHIQGLKIVDVMKQKPFQDMGFVFRPAKK